MLALHAEGQITRPAWPLIGASEVAHERVVKVLPAVDAVAGEAVEPGAS